MNDKVTVPEAAKLLNISEGAVRQRIHRGTIASEKDDKGTVYVTVTAEDTRDNGVNTPGENGHMAELVDELRDRISFLEQDLEDRKEEARRKDTIIMALTNRIPELEAPENTPPEPPESPVTDGNGERRGVVPPEPEKRSWWRRILAI